MSTVIETMAETMSGPDFENLSGPQKTLCKFLYLAGAHAMMQAIDNLGTADEAEAEKKLAELVMDTSTAFHAAVQEVVQTHMLHHLPTANTRPS